MEKQREERKELEMQQLGVVVFLISLFFYFCSCAVLEVLCTQLFNTIQWYCIKKIPFKSSFIMILDVVVCWSLFRSAGDVGSYTLGSYTVSKMV